MSEGFASSTAERATQLLVWWQDHGRQDPALKPWMFTLSGEWPPGTQQLDPYSIWIAEVMLCSAA